MAYSTKLALGIFATLLVFGILGTCMCSDNKQSQPPVRLVREDKEPTNLANIAPGSEHDNFFSNGLGYMAEMQTPQIEDQYMEFMSQSTGGGYHFMNPAQIEAEISRMTDDRITVGTEIQKRERPSFKSSLGYIHAAVDEGSVKSVDLQKE